MDALPINILDLVLGGVILIAALLGFSVGFVRGVLFVLCWVGAVLATLYGFPLAQPYTRQVIDTPLIADVAAGAGLFVATLIMLFIVSHIIGGLVKGSGLNALDRSLGLVGAIGATAAVICLVYIPVVSVFPAEEQPAWAREARSMPFIELGATALRRLGGDALDTQAAREAVEKRAREAIAAQQKKALETLTSPSGESAGAAERKGYNSGERGEMERLMRQSTE